MRQFVLQEIDNVNHIINELINTDSPLNEEQLSDVTNIQNALDVLRKRVNQVAIIPNHEDERMQTLHELTGPINGIVGYLFILDQDYDDNILTDLQRSYVKKVDKHVHQIYEHISQILLDVPDE